DSAHNHAAAESRSTHSPDASPQTDSHPQPSTAQNPSPQSSSPPKSSASCRSSEKTTAAYIRCPPAAPTSPSSASAEPRDTAQTCFDTLHASTDEHAKRQEDVH